MRGETPSRPVTLRRPPQRKDAKIKGKLLLEYSDVFKVPVASLNREGSIGFYTVTPCEIRVSPARTRQRRLRVALSHPVGRAPLPVSVERQGVSLPSLNPGPNPTCTYGSRMIKALKPSLVVGP